MEIYKCDRIIAKFMNEETIKEGIEVLFTYSTSWNSLMPVVAKIEGLGFDFCVMKRSVFIRREYDYWEVYKDTNKIHAVYNAVVGFAEWYNKNK